MKACRLILHISRTPPLSELLDFLPSDKEDPTFAMGCKHPDEVSDRVLRPIRLISVEYRCDPATGAR